MKFAPPPHTTEVFLASGPVRVEDGFVTLDKPTDADLRGLAAAGFTAVDDKAAPAAKPVTEAKE